MGLSKLLSSIGQNILTTPAAVKQELEGIVNAKLQSLLENLAVVPREEFEALKARVANLELALTIQPKRRQTGKTSQPKATGEEDAMTPSPASFSEANTDKPDPQAPRRGRPKGSKNKPKFT